MRYYRLEIGPGPSGNAGAVYTSKLSNGMPDPGALQIEFDVPFSPFGAPIGNAFVRLYGISLQTISQAYDFNGAPVKLFVGMLQGLPLANPAQSGLILQGTINQAFGNWIGTSMTLDLVVITDGGASQSTPGNIVLHWLRGTSLQDAIGNTMHTAFPEYDLSMAIDPRLVLTQDETGYFQTMEQFAQYLNTVSRSIIRDEGYNGVAVTVTETRFSVYDGTTPTAPKLIDFNDLVGQPTWIESPQIQINCVLRADLNLGDYVKLPPTQATSTQQSLSQYRDRSVFQGVFQIVLIRHVGNSRQADAGSWITTFNAVPQTAAIIPNSQVQTSTPATSPTP